MPSKTLSVLLSFLVTVRHNTLALALPLALCRPCPARAQDSTVTPPSTDTTALAQGRDSMSSAQLGERVRVTSHLGRIEGRFDGLRGDTLALSRGDLTWGITPLDSVRLVEAHRCCRTPGAGRARGAVIGGIVGTAFGVGSAVVVCQDDTYVCDLGDGGSRRSLALFVLSRSAVGAMLGALWGHFHPGKTWLPVGLTLMMDPAGPQRAVDVGLSVEVRW